MKEQLLVALRVISAFQKHIHPSPADVKLLRDWVDPHEQSLDADELACAIIAAYMKRQNRPIIMRDGDRRERIGGLAATVQRGG